GHGQQVTQVVEVEVLVDLACCLRSADTCREVEVEGHVEDVALPAPAYECGRQAFAEQSAVAHPQHVDHRRRVDGLTGAGRDALAAHRPDALDRATREILADRRLGHDAPRTSSRSRRSRALSRPSWCLRITPRLSRTTSSSRMSAPRAT